MWCQPAGAAAADMSSCKTALLKVAAGCSSKWMAGCTVGVTGAGGSLDHVQIPSVVEWQERMWYIAGECWVQQHLDGRLYSWGEGARQALGQNADAVGRGVAIAHVVSAGADGATHPRSPQARLLRSR